MKIKAIEPFFDLIAKVDRNIGDEFEVAADRGLALTTKDNAAKRPLCCVVEAELKAEAKKPRKKAIK